jgi:hypothetical protein
MPGVLAKAPEQHCWTFWFKEASEQLPPYSNSQVYLQTAAHVTQQDAVAVEAKIVANTMEKNKVRKVDLIIFIFQFLHSDFC